MVMRKNALKWMEKAENALKHGESSYTKLDLLVIDMV